MSAVKDMTGQCFGKLSVIERAGSQGGFAAWKCQCACGNTVSVIGTSLRRGLTQSCGCSNHGYDGTPTYRSWSMMKNRCSSSTASNYKYYGGRGIEFCSRWHNFEEFLKDMGKRPEKTSLDRINNNGNYEPNNCRWASAKQQASNRRPKKC